VPGRQLLSRQRQLLPQRKSLSPLSLPKSALTAETDKPSQGTDASACAQAIGTSVSAGFVAPTSGPVGGSDSGSINVEPTGTGSGSTTAPTPNYAADSWRSKGANVGFAGLMLGAVIML
jgi:hypothetical protein